MGFDDHRNPFLLRGQHRLYGENFVVDDMIWTARVVGEFMGIPGHGRRISIRILHVFEFRGGLISRKTSGSTPVRQSRNSHPRGNRLPPTSLSTQRHSRRSLLPGTRAAIALIAAARARTAPPRTSQP